MNEKQIIGFIGTGVMGKSMARNLLKKGHEVLVYNRTKAKTAELVEEGAVWCETVADVAKKADVIITIVGYPTDVEEVYLGTKGILNNAKAGAYVIDMTTSSPLLAKKIHDEATKKGIFALDAPVSGGDIGAKSGKLAIMVGADKEAFEAVKPIFSIMGENVKRLGPPGSGQYTKMANQIAIASTMMGVCEAMAYAKKAGLDQKQVIETIETGAAGSFSLSKLAPRMIDGDFEPGFYIKHFIKDMKIALQSAEEMDVKTPGLTLAKNLYEQLANKGEENAGTQALYKYYFS
ncbi:NAD(P)-dependent oxidoreductase [Evansella cellulosilytica]|uniref:6-phosphogluconate dehydrogenase NAD-binding protein n=1 Tax=Evansella cellulosilytica (strain ATCC 21833 / DSM 2522 / FERM P-1141 / JCM 9156 / N-4) TaxID=649639 RepID=E6TY54_EVAC2|nr:NAD(P)-dependent oxidoreductase [Evansella cellulosilytica]ADU32373.1 6-phosphogluconate dehydrogenase NAD-binding protein [Evansella cellulosilytica DSM 2522]